MSAPMNTPADQLSSGSALAGKTALVTGAGRNIGRAIALALAQAGARVAVNVRGSLLEGQAVVDEIIAQGGEALLVPADVTDRAQVDAMVAAVVARFGGLDILVNAAAWGAFKPIMEMDYERDWRATITGELDLVFLACKAAWPHFIARGGGSIINFASANAHTTLAGSPALAHCAGKGGVLAMTRQLAAEGAPHRIRANTISPALVVTDATRPSLELPGFVESVMAKSMLKMLGQPEDVAWCATYLASDESRWVTAADFIIDGGAVHC